VVVDAPVVVEKPALVVLDRMVVVVDVFVADVVTVTSGPCAASPVADDVDVGVTLEHEPRKTATPAKQATHRLMAPPCTLPP